MIERERLTQQMAALEGRRRWIIRLSWAGACLGIIATLYFYGAGSMAGVWVGVVMGAGASYLFKKFIEKPLDATRAALDGLVMPERRYEPKISGCDRDRSR